MIVVLLFNIGDIVLLFVGTDCKSAISNVTYPSHWERLVNEDLVHKLATPHGTVKYASCNHKHENHSHSHQHIHFNCDKCLAVTCLENIEPIFKIPEDYIVKEMNFTLTGLCPNCNRKVFN